MNEEVAAVFPSAIAREPGGDVVTWRTSRRDIDLSSPVLMGILNITPDSFSDGGRFFDAEAALAQLERMRDEGADIVDVGGESTRPGAAPVPAEEEVRRVIPVIEAAVRRFDIPLSVDTTKSAVARAALDAGVEIVNDISGLRYDRVLAELAAETGAGLVLMHIRGRPRTMQVDIHYDDLLGEIMAELTDSVETARAAGCRREQLVVDPGIGFGKTAEHNLEILDRLDRIAALGPPVMIGPSRKSFIGKALGLDVEERIEGTIAACVVGLLRGARIFRVHDVEPVRRALDMAQAIVGRESRGKPA
jgi:dihydropteroate synthase